MIYNYYAAGFGVVSLRAFASIFLKDRVFFAFKQKSLSGFCIQILLDW